MGGQGGAVGRGIARVDGAAMPALIVSYSRAKQLMAVLGCLAFAAGGAALILHGEVALGILVSAGFGLLALIGIRNLVAGSHAALSELGLHVRHAGAELWIPWDEVAAARLTRLSTPVAIGVGWRRMRVVRALAVDTTAPPRATGSWWGRAGARARVTPEQGDINIPVDLLPVDAEALACAIERLARDPEARRGVADGLPELRLLRPTA